MANILLGLTGSVAAIKAPDLFQGLRLLGHSVRVVATQHSRFFFDCLAIDGRSKNSSASNTLIVDDDEWLLCQDRSCSTTWQKGDPILHIELRKWADLLIIAPLDANTLAKLAFGMCDNCLTCVWRAWDLAKPRIIAPAMNTFMWNHPATLRHLITIASDSGLDVPDLKGSQLLTWLTDQKALLQFASPEIRKLACGDDGIGAMASIESLLFLATRAIQNLHG